MRIPVFSDSHSELSYMYACIDAYKPDVIMHLGDYYADAQTVHGTCPQIPMYCVPGNCDEYRSPVDAERTQVVTVGGVKFMLTHGHLHRVKQHTMALEYAAMERKADAVLYGHTHIADCRQISGGMWVMNPGSCGYLRSSAGLIEVENGKIRDMRIIRK